MAKKKSHDADRIIGILQSGARQDLLILIVPSHDRRKKQLNNQDAWANAALELFADLYRGATAFKALKGIFKTESGEILVDEPILIECYAARNDVEDRTKLEQLLKFAKRMGRETNQDTVALVINDVFHEINDFS